MVPKVWWWMAIAGLLIAASLPVLRKLTNRDNQSQCVVDGQTIDPLFRVRLISANGVENECCCLRCAELWFENTRPTPEQIFVTDEASGEPLDATNAYYVYSDVFSNAPNRDRRHVFRVREDAEAHLATFRGRMLIGSKRPFTTSQMD